MSIRLMTTLVALVVVIFLARAVYFQLRATFLRKVEVKWCTYIKKQKAGYDDPDVRWLEERTQKVKRLVEESGNRPGDLSAMQPAGYGFVQPQTYSVLENWLAKSANVAPLVSAVLIRAQGHYRDERNRNLNPLSWVEYLVFLPRHVIGSIDPRIPKWVKDVAQIAYWIAGFIAAIRKIME